MGGLKSFNQKRNRRERKKDLQYQVSRKSCIVDITQFVGD
nr:MAG TPA: hypothetical protein [Caudoviricetes sp.]